MKVLKIIELKSNINIISRYLRCDDTGIMAEGMLNLKLFKGLRDLVGMDVMIVLAKRNLIAGINLSFMVP